MRVCCFRTGGHGRQGHEWGAGGRQAPPERRVFYLFTALQAPAVGFDEKLRYRQKQKHTPHPACRPASAAALAEYVTLTCYAHVGGSREPAGGCGRAAAGRPLREAYIRGVMERVRHTYRPGRGLEFKI